VVFDDFSVTTATSDFAADDVALAPAGASASNLVPALVRGLRLLQAFSPARPRLPMSELVTYVGAPRSTVARLVRSLVALGFLVEDEMGRLSPGHASLGLGASYLAGSAVVRRAGPMLDGLANQTLAAAQLLALDGAEAVVLAQVLPAGMGGACAVTRVGARFAVSGSGLCSGVLSGADCGARDIVRIDGEAPWTFGDVLAAGDHEETVARTLPLIVVPVLRHGKVAYALSVGVQEGRDAASMVERAKLALAHSVRAFVSALNGLDEGVGTDVTVRDSAPPCDRRMPAP
jgi:hypothetical protein